MSLTAREAFKFGFLSRCVEQGLSLEETHAMVKQADSIFTGPLGILTDLAKGGIGTVTDTAKQVSPWVGAGLAAAPLVGGGLAGYGLAKATDIDEKDVDEIKRDEIRDEYERQTDLLRRAKAIRDARASKKRSGRLLM